jgi:hypothetical protein
MAEYHNKWRRKHKIAQILLEKGAKEAIIVTSKYVDVIGFFADRIVFCQVHAGEGGDQKRAKEFKDVRLPTKVRKMQFVFYRYRQRPVEVAL